MITNERPHDMSVKQTVAPDHKKHWGLLEGSTHLPQMTLLVQWLLRSKCVAAREMSNYMYHRSSRTKLWPKILWLIVFENPFLYEDRQHIF